jgi:DNA-directed RNA polymerase specialized sigma subunit
MTDQEQRELFKAKLKWSSQVVGKLLKQMPKSIVTRLEREHWDQAGKIGLWSACTHWKTGGTAKFTTYAFRCIRNAMMDECRTMVKYDRKHFYQTLDKEVVDGLCGPEDE